MSVKTLVLLLLLPAQAMAQGFAGLGTTADGFATPVPGRALDFPADHGPHPAYRIEWWYLTANMTGRDGTPYGLQWTLSPRRMARAGIPLSFGWAMPL